MFSRILIANRGEVALRIIRACREMGIESVCVYSTADKDAPYLKLALACEHFDQTSIAASAAEIGLDADTVNLAHVDALIWSEGIDI